MRSKLDVLKTRYTTLAEVCDFQIPKNVGHMSQGLKNVLAVSGSDFFKDDTDDDEEDDEVSGNDNE